jgi:hypothetical protein
MITWHKVINASEIGGSAAAETGASTNIWNVGVNGDVSQTITGSHSHNWFAGKSEGEEGAELDGVLNDFGFVARTDTGTQDFPYGALFWTSTKQKYSEGQTTYNSYGQNIEIDDGDFTIGGATESSSTEENTDWSFYTTELVSHELTTLSNQGGTTTTQTEIEVDVYTTSGNPPASTISKRAASSTTAITVNTLTRQSWTNTSTYQATVSTGQTTTIAYSVFGNSAPLLIISGEPTTAASTVSPLSFYPKNGVAPGETVFTKTFIDQGQSVEATRTVATQGSSVVGAFPSIAASGLKIASATIQQSTTSAGEEEVANAMSATLSSGRSTTELSHLPFAGVSMSFSKTVTELVDDLDPLGYVSYEYISEYVGVEEVEEYEFSEAPALLAGPRLKRVSQFGYNEITIAHSVDVFVAGKTNGAKGASFPTVASQNSFATHTMVGAIPASGTFANSDSSVTFYGDSYTFKSGTNPTQSSVYQAEGDSTSQWTYHNAENVVVLGGPIPGQAFINYGVFEVYSGSVSSTVSKNLAEVTTWSAGQETTAFVGRDKWISTQEGVDVSVFERWNITNQPIDD